MQFSKNKLCHDKLRIALALLAFNAIIYYIFEFPLKKWSLKIEQKLKTVFFFREEIQLIRIFCTSQVSYLLDFSIERR